MGNDTWRRPICSPYVMHRSGSTHYHFVLTPSQFQPIILNFQVSSNKTCYLILAQWGFSALAAIRKTRGHPTTTYRIGTSTTVCPFTCTYFKTRQSIVDRKERRWGREKLRQRMIAPSGRRTIAIGLHRQILDIPSPHRIDAINWGTQGVLVGAWERHSGKHFLYRFQACKFHTGIQALRNR